MAGNSNPQENPQGPSGKDPRAKTFSCTNCGASITVRYMGHSLSVVCESCKSVLDARDENLRIIDKYFKVTKQYQPKIPLGSRGKIKGREWELIGFVVRQDVSSYYTWQEYLLFNPYYGYRWLALNNGHWSLVTMLKQKPKTHSRYFTGGTNTKANFDLNEYKIYFVGKARVIYVLGEFYWNVKVGTEVSVADYVCPPYMLSREGDDKEEVWSQAEYVTGKEIQEAFKDLTEIPYAVGIAPNQPTGTADMAKKVAMAWIAFVVIAFCIQFVQLASSRGELVLNKVVTYAANKKNAPITTDLFTLDKGKGNVRINLKADVNNSWLYVYGELVNEDTDETYSFERTLQYYYGYTDGEHWTEGSKTAYFLISAVPAGKYRINLYTESGDFKKLGMKSFTVNVFRRVKTYANCFWVLLFLSVPACLMIYRRYAEEVERWSDSDFSPYATGTDY